MSSPCGSSSSSWASAGARLMNTPLRPRTDKVLSPPSGGGAMVGVYTDNLPMTDSNTGGLSQTLGALFDMERVEVLKGPQGTLYEEGNLGGSIRYITKKPDPSGFDYSFQTSIEDIGESDGLSYRAAAMVNTPLGDRLAACIVAYRRDRVGILDQVAPRNENDVDTFLSTKTPPGRA